MGFNDTNYWSNACSGSVFANTMKCCLNFQARPPTPFSPPTLAFSLTLLGTSVSQCSVCPSSGPGYTILPLGYRRLQTSFFSTSLAPFSLISAPLIMLLPQVVMLPPSSSSLPAPHLPSLGA